MIQNRFDLIVIGAGIHGVMTAWLAAMRGHSVCLVEKDKPGSGASGSWFGILHGGLRYLQTMDLARYRQSIVERRWFLRTFPDHIETMPFMMPLYGQGLKRPNVFRAAFAIDALLSFDRVYGVEAARRLPTGRVIGRTEAIEKAPFIIQDRLRGGALWHEAVVPDMNALFQAIVSRTLAAGAVILEETAVSDLCRRGEMTTGVKLEDGSELYAPCVINAAGGAAYMLAKRFDPLSVINGGSALAFNLMLNVSPPAAVGLAVYGKGGTDALFLYPHETRTFLGTWYVEQSEKTEKISVEETAIDAMLAASNERIANGQFDRADIEEITAGLLPVTHEGTVSLARSDLSWDHGRYGGPKGLYTLRGIKYTTARHAAKQILHLAGM